MGMNIPSFLFLSEHTVYRLSFFIITHGAFDADPRSMQDACHNEPSKYDLARHQSPSGSVVQWLERPTGVREVMGSIPIGN